MIATTTNTNLRKRFADSYSIYSHQRDTFSILPIAVYFSSFIHYMPLAWRELRR